MKNILSALLMAIALTSCGGGGANEQTQQSTNTPTLRTGEVTNMPAGFQVIGDHGGIQVDENFINFSFFAKGFFSHPGSGVDYSFTVNGVDTPIICFNSTSPVMLRQAIRNGASMTYTVRVGNPSNTQIEWFIFDKVPNTPTSVGLNVYDATGRITFSSAYVPMRIVGFVKIPDGDVDANTDVVSLASPRGAGKYAACLSHAKIRSMGDVITTLFVQGVSTDAYGGKASFVSYLNVPISLSANQPYGGYLFVVDVAGL